MDSSGIGGFFPPMGFSLELVKKNQHSMGFSKGTFRKNVHFGFDDKVGRFVKKNTTKPFNVQQCVLSNLKGFLVSASFLFVIRQP